MQMMGIQFLEDVNSGTENVIYQFFTLTADLNVLKVSIKTS